MGTPPHPLSPSAICRTREQIQHLWNVLEIGETTTDEVFATRIYDVLPSNPVFSHYIGSLTTPPCTEVRADSSERRMVWCVCGAERLSLSIRKKIGKLPGTGIGEARLRFAAELWTRVR